MHDDRLFDEKIAATYDDDKGISAPEVIEPAVDLLAELAGGGRALEFAIGTGRIALPLARKGVQVEGIELSRPMVSRLRAKEGGAEISVAIGDMVTTDVARRFSLVYLVFNTINNLTSQDAQLACFRNAAAHLEPGGHFLIEVGVPPLQRLPVGETILAFDHGETHWGIDEYDVVNQNFSVRFPFVYGDGDGHLESLPKYVGSWHPAQRMSTIPHRDIATAMKLALNGSFDRRVVNVADEAPASIYELSDMLGARMDSSAEPLSNPWYLLVDSSLARSLGFRASVRTVYQAQQEA
ncbi:class I SAM-dependent methyltransferase [Rhizobium leguminosarum]|uniref:class I SAM-dependent methyltransferase n=1 Tax=Rhizobium leguminosarum TaxID=384 RepID=UPI00037BBC22|nr:class I SAM-dependent methyltransferase [Rhizobium leguminosarum]